MEVEGIEFQRSQSPGRAQGSGKKRSGALRRSGSISSSVAASALISADGGAFNHLPHRVSIVPSRDPQL